MPAFFRSSETLWPALTRITFGPYFMLSVICSVTRPDEPFASPLAVNGPGAAWPIVAPPDGGFGAVRAREAPGPAQAASASVSTSAAPTYNLCIEAPPRQRYSRTGAERRPVKPFNPSSGVTRQRSAPSPGQMAAAVLAPDLGGLAAAPARAAAHALGDPLDDVVGENRVQEVDTVRLAGGQHPTARVGHRRRERLVVVVGEAERHAHVARAPLGEREPRHLQRRLDVGERPLVLDLQPEEQLAARVERPRVGHVQVLARRNSPDLGRVRLAAAAAPAVVEPVADPERVERVA